MNKFRLWLLAHGVEFERSEAVYDYRADSLVIVINHRYFGFDFGLMIRPFKGVYSDELNTPHAEIAAQRIAPRRPPTEADLHRQHARKDAELIAELPKATQTAIDLMLTAATDGTPRESLSQDAQRALEKFDAETAEVRAELVNMIAEFQQHEQGGQQ